MAGGQAAVARATAAVFVDGQRAGSAVLVGPRYLVTAAHVLQRQDPDTLAKVAVEQVELEFPDQGPDRRPGRAAAARVDLGPASRGVDVAVLDLGEDRPGWLPAPVPVWPAARLWLNSGVPATEVARRAGHGVAVLLKIYAHCIDGQATAANQRIADALGTQDAGQDPGDEDDDDTGQAAMSAR